MAAMARNSFPATFSLTSLVAGCRATWRTPRWSCNPQPPMIPVLVATCYRSMSALSLWQYFQFQSKNARLELAEQFKNSVGCCRKVGSMRTGIFQDNASCAWKIYQLGGKLVSCNARIYFIKILHSSRCRGVACALSAATISPSIYWALVGYH